MKNIAVTISLLLILYPVVLFAKTDESKSKPILVLDEPNDVDIFAGIGDSNSTATSKNQPKDIFDVIAEQQKAEKQGQRILECCVVFAICATTAIGIYLFVIWKQDSARFWKTKKLIILWTGTFVVVALCLFPPWVANDKFVGHAYLFSDGNSYKSHIDLVRLIIQCAIVGLITGVLLYTLNVKKAEDGGK